MNVDLRAVAEIEKMNSGAEEGNARHIFGYLRRYDGCLIFWQFELGARPGQAQSAMVIEDA